MSEAARRLFDRIETEADIQALLDEEEPETLHLDYKEVVANPTRPQRRELERLLAKALSAFANADGGVIILGVKDAPRELSPIADLVVMDLWVNEQISRLVSFPIPGVLTEKIPAAANDGTGYLKVLVPASDMAPHRSQKNHRYYFRTGDSTLPMEHYQVADAFGRRHRPILKLLVRLENDILPGRPGHRALVAHIGLKNSGRAVARFPLLQIHETTRDLQPYQYVVPDGRPRGLVEEPYRGGVNQVVHAGDVLQVFQYFRDIPDGGSFSSPDQVGLKIVASVAAQDFPMTQQTLTLTNQDLNDVLAGQGAKTEFEAE